MVMTYDFQNVVNFSSYCGMLNAVFPITGTALMCISAKIQIWSGRST